MLKDSLRLPSAILLALCIAGCDQTPGTAPSTTKAPPKVAATGEGNPVGTVSTTAPLPLMDFANDAAFAEFAASLEPRTSYVQGAMRGIHLTRQGTWACGYRFGKPNYIFWSVGNKPGDFKSFYLDEEMGGSSEPKGSYSSRDRYTQIARDGKWGCFVFPESTSDIRMELWKLPVADGEKPQRFHTIESLARKDLQAPSISVNGDMMLCIINGRWRLLKIDAATGTVRNLPLDLPAELFRLARATLRFHFAGPGGRIAIHKTQTLEENPETRHHSLGTGEIIIDESDPATPIARINKLQWIMKDSLKLIHWIGESPDGHHAVLRLEDVDDLKLGPATIWGLVGRDGENATQILELPQTVDVGTVRVAWSNDAQQVALVADTHLYVFDAIAFVAGNTTPVHTEKLGLTYIDVAFTADQSQVALLGFSGQSTLVPLGKPREVNARIGEARIHWDVPREAPAIERWPALKVTGHIKHPHEGAEDQVPSTLIMEVTNAGTGPAQQVRSTLTIAPAYAPASTAKAPAPEPEQPDATQPEPISHLGTLHLGTLVESTNVMRFLDLPVDPALLSKARRFTLATTSKFDFNPAPIHWLHLPRTIMTQEQYHAQAKVILDSATKLLADARGIPFKELPTLSPMGKTGFGFMVSFRSMVRYQDPFVMGDEALRINRAVMQVDSQDDLMRHAQMMLFWYLPHELVHCADHRSSWATEFVANTVQPYLTARMLESMPDAPYDAQSMAFVYDRYVEALRPHLKAEDIARVERFIQNNGEGAPPWTMSAPDLFQSNTPAYVYFGARINQHSWSKQSKLEDLCRQYLVPATPEAKPAE